MSQLCQIDPISRPQKIRATPHKMRLIDLLKILGLKKPSIDKDEFGGLID